MSDPDALTRVLQGAGLILVGTVFSLAAGFASRALVANALGPEEYGLLSLGLSIVTVLAVFSRVGLDEGMARYLPRLKEGDQRYAAYIALAFSGLVSMLMGGGLLLLADPIANRVFGDPNLSDVLRTLWILVPLLAISAVCVSLFRGYQRTLERVIVRDLLHPALRLGLVGAAVVLGAGLAGVIGGWVIAAAGSFTVAIALALRRLPVFGRVRERTERSIHSRKLLLFSVPLMLSSVISILLMSIDNLLIGYYRGSTAVGWYDAAFILVRALPFVLTAFAYLFMPVFSELDADSATGEMRTLYQSVTKWATSLTLPGFVVLVLFPREVLSALFGAEYLPAVAALVVLSVGFFLRVLSGLCGDAVKSLGHSRFVLGGNIVLVCLNVILNVALIPRLGITGAAIASAVSAAIGNGLFVLKLYAETRIHPVFPAFSRVVVSASIGLVPLLAVKRFIDVKFWMLPLLAGFYLFFYLGTLTAAGGIRHEDIAIVDAVEESAGFELVRIRRLMRRYA